jgi:hypothetical protein
VKKKIRKISFGRALYISWTPKRLMVGRPNTKRHVTVERRGRALKFHLTDERFPPGDPRRPKPLATIRFDQLEKLQEELEAAGVKAFIEGLVPVTAEELEDAGFQLMTIEAFGMKAVRAILKPKIRPNLRLRAPSERELLEIADHAANRLRPAGDLDTLVHRTPGTVSAVFVEEDLYISWPLYHYPRGLIHPDGSKLAPGWYALVDRDGIGSACSRVLLENIGPKFFPAIERALQFLGINVFGDLSAVEMEDVYRRLAAGERIESIRAEKLGLKDSRRVSSTG